MLRSTLRHSHASYRRVLHACVSSCRCCARCCSRPSCALYAQTGNRITEPPNPPPSRWQQDKEQLDSALRARALTVTDPRGLWVAGQLDTGDSAARVSAFAKARTQAPGEMVYLVSLGSPASSPCGRRFRSAMRPIAWPTGLRATSTTACRCCCWPTAPASATMQRRWSRFSRKRRRARASTITGAGERSSSGRKYERCPCPRSPRPRPSSRPPTAPPSRRMSPTRSRPCAAMRRRHPTSVRSACNAAGTATAQRAATWSLRVAGARLAERSAGAGPPQAAAQQLLADIQRRAFECAEAGDSGRARARVGRSPPCVRAPSPRGKRGSRKTRSWARSRRATRAAAPAKG